MATERLPLYGPWTGLSTTCETTPRWPPPLATEEFACHITGAGHINGQAGRGLGRGGRPSPRRRDGLQGDGHAGGVAFRRALDERHELPGPLQGLERREPLA